MFEGLKKETELLMKKAIEALKYQYTKIRTGRASATVLDGIMVDYYGTPTPIKQVGQISTPEARLLQIQPFDKTLMPNIEKSILGANIGLTPSNDGNVIRIPFPQLTEERRKDQVKELKKFAEESRVAIRNIRRDMNEKIKKSEKGKEISEDESKKFQSDIQTVTDNYIKEVDQVLASKEKEVMTI
jgi:ribosome recycling factor